MDCKEYGRIQMGSNLWSYTGSWLEGLQKLRQDSHSSSLDLNLGSPEYKKEC